MTGNFSRAHSLPNHFSSQQIANPYQVAAELKFLSSVSGNIINSLSNIQMTPAFDPTMKQLFSKQPLFCNFTIVGTP